ncbi:uncharacterized protein LOC127860419 isoform X1 [Dreissena polymorpha]|nr:uncharacterized protein LOC127860419 isoform X1 [Dreissena polymorpha]
MTTNSRARDNQGQSKRKMAGRFGLARLGAFRRTMIKQSGNDGHLKGAPYEQPENWKATTPGLDIKSILHHSYLVPLHFFTGLGAICAGAYIIYMGLYEDTQLFKYFNPPDVKPDEKLSLYEWKGPEKEIELLGDRPELPVHLPSHRTYDVINKHQVGATSQ